ncbi:MAG: hypothetical protein KGD67_12460 [Candidatus Lokiarchaeota archaeon]|nr:hypothetical protein [Candidatus Lokiarchaeota archaeon]
MKEEIVIRGYVQGKKEGFENCKKEVLKLVNKMGTKELKQKIEQLWQEEK